MGRSIYSRRGPRSDATRAADRAKRAVILRLASEWFKEIPENAAQICRENGVLDTDVFREVYARRTWAKASAPNES